MVPRAIVETCLASRVVAPVPEVYLRASKAEVQGISRCLPEHHVVTAQIVDVNPSHGRIIIHADTKGINGLEGCNAAPPSLSKDKVVVFDEVDCVGATSVVGLAQCRIGRSHYGTVITVGG